MNPMSYVTGAWSDYKVMRDQNRKTAKKPSGRADIQGLRMVAVLSVIANHLWDNPVGGFVGVDVFFVLSGFLITGLLMRERERKGQISFANFYRRRARRILPAATLVIVATIAATYYLFNSGRGETVARDGVWAFFFASNWHFAEIGTNYFANDGLISPLQHYWSLAVEEQFYIVWPWLILLTFAIAGRTKHARTIVFLVMATACVASFVYSMWHTGEAPLWAYFSTVDRAWELGLGACLAAAVPLLEKLPAWFGVVGGWGGLAIILASFWVINDDVSFPAPWAAMPVIGTALVIAAGTGRDQRHLLPLVNPVARYIGDISYSLYLWHFPFVILLLAYWPDGGIGYSLAVLGGTLTASVLCYHVIEDPIRTSAWLEPHMVQRWRARRQSGEPLFGRTQQLQGVGALAVVTVVLSAIALNPSAPPISASSLVASDPGNDKLTPGERQNKLVAVSLTLERFPDFKPSVDELGIANWTEVLKERACTGTSDDAGLDACRTEEPGAKKLAVVVGDSFGMSWIAGINAALVPKGYAVQQLTRGECPAWDVPVTAEGGAPFPECDAHREWSFAKARELHPDLLIIASSPNGARHLVSGAESDARRLEVEQGMEKTLQELDGVAPRTVVLAAPPNSGNLQSCVTAVGSPADCTLPIDDDWWIVHDAEAAASEAEGVEYIETRDWFCFENECPGIIGATAVTAEGAHLTWEYSEELGPALRDVLLATE